MTNGITRVEHLRARCCVDAETGCWHWQGAKAVDGTPRIHTLDHARLDKRVMSGPKAAWNIAHGEAPPPSALVFRRCGQRDCLNPVHLALARDKAEIGEHWRRAGYRKGTALESRRANVRLAQAASGKVPTPAAVVLAIRAADAMVSGVELARRFGVTHQVVSRIRRGESHRHLLQEAV